MVPCTPCSTLLEAFRVYSALVYCNNIARIRYRVDQEFVAAFETIGEVARFQNAVFDRPLGDDLGVHQLGEGFPVYVVADDQEVNIALFIDEYTACKEKFNLAALRDFAGERANIVKHFNEDAFKFVEENKLFVHDVEFFAILVFAL